MIIRVERKWCKDKYTIGNMYVDGEWFCNTLEDKVRDINRNGRFDNGEKKVYGETAIPYGTYEITLDVVSPKFSKYEFYMDVCDGRLPRLLNVPHFEGILIHVADGHRGADLLEGCIGVGYNRIKGGLLNGKEVFRGLYEKMSRAIGQKEKIIIIFE